MAGRITLPRLLFAQAALWLLLLASSGCEVAANFDPKKLDTDRTIGPVPLPTLDGAMALIPDADVGDAAIGPPPAQDAGALGPSDAAGLDAEVQPGPDAAIDAAEAVYADADAAEPDSGNDGSSDADTSLADAESP